MSERAVLTDSRRRLSSHHSGISNHSSNNNNDPFSPLIIMSGYVVKRTRGFTTKWQKRYYQLLGDGALIYFSGDHRLKVLGEIDIAHTCYEVRHGSENCDVKFPSAVPPNCCFSVAVLKRTYYFYTFKEEETEKWVQALNSTSYLINRLRPRRLNCNPAVQVAIKALHETSPNPPSTQPPPSQHKPPPPIPPYNPVGDSSSEENDNGFSELPNFSKMTHGGRRNMSVPDLRFDSSITCNNSWIDGSPRIRSSSISTAAATPPSPLTLSSTKKQNMQHQQRRRKRVVCSPQFSDIQTESPTYENVGKFKPQRYMSQGNLLFEDSQMEFKTLPSPARLNKMKQKWKSAYDVQLSPAFERLEELQQKEDAIRKRIEEMKRFESFSQLPYHGGVHVLPTPSSPSFENIPLMSLSQHAPYNEKTELPPISPAYHSQPNPPEFMPPSALRKTSVEAPTVKKTKTAPKVSPKPSGRRPTPAPVFSQSIPKPNKEGNNYRMNARISEDSRENFAILEDINEEENVGIDTSKSINASAGDVEKGGMKKSKSETKSLDAANVWVKKEMSKVCYTFSW